MNTKMLGRWGEAVAARYLKEKGCSITGMSYKSRFGEIDIIAEDNRYIIFVEVKLRKTDKFGNAAEYVGRTKQQKLLSTAKIYLAANETKKQPRFDIIEVYAPDGVDTKAPEINHIINAFGDDNGYTSF